MNNVELQKRVWNNLKGSVAKAKKFEDLVAVSISLLSEENEDMFIAVRDGQLMVEPHPYNDNNCQIEATAETIDKMFAGEISFDKALADGLVKVKRGDVAKLKALECLVPAKKTAKTAKPAAKTAAKAESKSASKAEPKPAVKAEVKTEAKPAAKPAVKTEVKTEAKPAAKPEVKPAAKTENKQAKKQGKK